MDLVIPRGTRLFHGTIEPFDPAELTVGGYDNVLWTADNACIAQSYIPCGGGSSLVAIEYLDRPSQDRSTQAIQARIGLDFGYGTPRGPEFDKNGRAVSWRIPAPWLEENYNDFWRRKAALKQKVIEAGWLPRSENSDVFEFKFFGGKLLEPGQCAEGRLFIITVEQDLKVFDMTNGGSVQGDLTDVDYHKLGTFRSAEKSGRDGVRINDYAQSEMWGNVGHTSIGIFKGSIKKLSWDVISAKNFDWPDWDTLRSGMTPELEAWLVEQAMARRNPRRRNTDGEVRALERKVFTGEGDDEDRQRLCVWWERTRLGLPIRKPEPQPHPVQDPNAKGGWSQILEINGRWHLKDAWDRSSNGVLEARDIEEDVHELLQDKAPEIEEVRRITFLEKPEYESHAELTGEDWWTYLIRVEGSVPFSDEDEEVDENPRRRNRPAIDLSKITVRVCDGADRTRTSSRRAYAHTFCKKGPVVCVASEFFGLPAGHRDGVMAHELGHLLAGPDAGEEAADRAFEAATGVRVRYKDGVHGRCLQWLSPKDRKSLLGLFEFDFEGHVSDAHGPDDDAVRFFVKDSDGKRELGSLEEAEAVAAEDLEAEVWATDGKRRLGWRPMARNPKHKRGALVPLREQIRHGVDLHGLPVRRNAVCPTCGATDAYKSPFSGRLECRVCDVVARRPRVGTKVRLKRNVERYPHFIAKKGSTGVVTSSDEDNLWVKLDEHLDGAEEWDNEIQWFDDFLHDVDGDLEVMTPAGVRRNARSPDAWKTPPPCDTEATGKPLTKAIAKKLADKPVRVHLNLHNGCYVFTSRGKVTAYARFFYLKDVLPRVGVGGYRRCHELNVRNDHAYLEGTFIDGEPPTKRGKGWRQITYNCKTNKRPCFYYVDNEECFEGASEVRAWRVDNGDGTERCEVWVKGAPPERKRNPPECRCELPGGACECGAVDDECAKVVADARRLK